MISSSFYRISLILCLFSSSYGALLSQNFDGGFNFNLPPFDSTTQKFLPTFPAKTISEADRVTVVGEKFMAGGQQIRFWGVNIIGGACFPKKTDAVRIVPHDKKWGLLRGMKTDSYGTISTPAPAYTNPNGNTFVTATNETKFDPTKGGLTTATPNFVSITGFLPDMPNTTVGDLQLVQANQFGALTWISLENKPLNASEKSLITFSSRQQNTNMVWSFYEDDPTQFTLKNNWGTAPTLQQPTILRLRLTVKADMIKLYPLRNCFKTYFALILLMFFE